MRRQDRKMSDDQTVKILHQGEYGILSTVDGDNNPYGIPLNYVIWQEQLYFHCAVEGRKLDNIKNNPRVCFTIVGKTCILPEDFGTEYESVIVSGRASIVEDDTEKVGALRQFVKKYSAEFVEEGDAMIERAKDRTKVVRIEIQQFAGKNRS